MDQIVQENNTGTNTKYMYKYYMAHTREQKEREKEKTMVNLQEASIVVDNTSQKAETSKKPQPDAPVGKQSLGNK
jgi:hypothetical protein